MNFFLSISWKRMQTLGQSADLLLPNSMVLSSKLNIAVGKAVKVLPSPRALRFKSSCQLLLCFQLSTAIHWKVDLKKRGRKLDYHCIKNSLNTSVYQCRFGEMLCIWQFFEGLFNIWQIANLLSITCFVKGQML